MTARIWRGMLMKTFADWNACNGAQKGAALAYYTLFSLAPLVLIAMALAGLVVGNGRIHDVVLAQVQSVIGHRSACTVAELILNLSDSMSTRTASAIGVALLFFGASGAVGELRTSLNQIWNVRPKENGFAVQIESQLLCLAFVLAAGAMLIASLILSTLAASLRRYFSDKLGLPVFVLHGLNFGGVFCVLTLLFAMIYKLLPETRIAWHDVWTGAATTAILLTLGNAFLGLYMDAFTGSSAYGAVGALLLLLVWAYYCAQILYFGAVFTHVYAETRGSKK